MKKNRIITMSLREIKKSKKRFFSLCVLSVLGVSFFVGMKMSGPTMLKSLDVYYDTNKMYDLKIISTLGLDDDDVSEIEKLNSNYKVLGSHTKDAMFNDGEHEAVLRIHEINNGMNEIIIKEGRLPENYNEIIVEDGFLTKTNYKVGDKINLKLEEDDTEINTNELTIVGIVLSPEYLNNSQITQSRGNTTLGNGQVAYYAYSLKDLFNIDYYTEVYILDKDAIEYMTNTSDYLDKINDDEKTLESIKENREQARFNKLIEEANNKLKEEEDKGNKELNEAEKKLNDFKKKLDNGKKTLDSTKKKLDNANTEIQKGNKLIKESKVKLSEGKKKLDSNKNDVNNKLKSYNTTYDKLANFIKKYDSDSSFSVNDVIKLFTSENIDVKKTIEDSLVNVKVVASTYGINLDSLFKQYGINIDDLIQKSDIYLNELIDAMTIKQLKDIIFDDRFVTIVKNSIPTNAPYYSKIIGYLDDFSNNKDDIKKLFSGVREIEKGYKDYNNNQKTISKKENELKKATKEYESGLKKYNTGIKEYKDNLELYNKSVIEFEDSKRKFQEEINLAKDKINKIKEATWFIQTREDNNEYITYISSYDSIEKLSNMFPVIFFLVSIMISLLSMARMAIEDRSEIGTLKALGFSNNDVRLKFVIYALLATLLGGVIGVISGYIGIPRVIIKVFNIMHNIPETIYSRDITPIIIGILISIACIVGSTIFTINNLVREKTTVLLRPIAPPIGKKILLEKIPFIWNKLKYSNKLTIRNIFRYKRRIAMSIFGIASCTMILLSGYGIKDSIAYVVDKQYNEINHNDVLISLDGKLSKEELDTYVNNDELDFNVYARIDQVDVDNKRVSLIIPDSEIEFRKVLSLKDVKTKEVVSFKDESVIITEKLAKYFNKKVGDKIKILESNNLVYEFPISSIIENYIGDYIYMSKETYKKNINEYNINTQYLKFKDLSRENEIMSNIKNNNSHILITVSISNAKELANTLFKSLNSIVIVLILFSGALSFVVFYSLAYINMSERQREIATLKVLGYYNREVDNYILKEEFIITLIGILFGLFFGTLYAYKLIDSIEINTMQYIKNIHLDSYLQTFGFIILFGLIVSIGVHYTLKKIDLIESLKSVE